MMTFLVPARGRLSRADVLRSAGWRSPDCPLADVLPLQAAQPTATGEQVQVILIWLRGGHPHR